LVQWCSDLVIVLAREDAEVNRHALQTMTEQFQLCEGDTVFWGKTASLFGNNGWLMGCT
jgi:hypothetical protein